MEDELGSCDSISFRASRYFRSHLSCSVILPTNVPGGLRVDLMRIKFWWRKLEYQSCRKATLPNDYINAANWHALKRSRWGSNKVSHQVEVSMKATDFANHDDVRRQDSIRLLAVVTFSSSTAARAGNPAATDLHV